MLVDLLDKAKESQLLGWEAEAAVHEEDLLAKNSKWIMSLRSWFEAWFIAACKSLKNASVGSQDDEGFESL